LVIIDTLTRAAGKRDIKKNLQEQDLGQVEELQRIALDYGVSIVVLCHTRKSEEGDFVDAVSGSHGLTGAVDAVLGFHRVRGSSSIKIDRSGRDFQDETPIYLRVELGSDQGSIRQITASEASSTGVIREGSIKEKVLAELNGRPGGLRPVEISNAIDPANTATTSAAVRKALGQLQADGFTVKVGDKYVRSDCSQIGLIGPKCGEKDV
jgi:hypothetical protein